MAISPYRSAEEVFGPIFNELFAQGGNGGRASSLLRTPPADVIETEKDIQVIAELPGLTAEDVSVDIENNVLTISGEKQVDRKEGDDRGVWHLSERRYGQFSRSFVLPRDVDQENIHASFDNGVLKVSVPKSERARRRKIEVQGGRTGQTVHTNAQ